jgi:regulator of RNase E activity RraA
VDVSSWGGLLSLAAKLRDLSGVIVDGACRDVDEIREVGLAVYARGVVPVTARGRIVQHSLNEEVQCGDAVVRPHDLVIADGSGVVFIPREREREVIEEAEAIVARESRMAEALRAGRPVVEVMGGLEYESMLARGKPD